MTQTEKNSPAHGNCLSAAVQKLVDILADQRRHAAGLLELLAREYDALLANDIQGLTEINARKKAVVERSADLEIRCIHQMEALAAMLGLDERPKLGTLVGYLDQPLAGKLEKARSLFKNILLKVRESNKTNQALLKQCLGLVDQSLAVLNNIYNPPAVYGRDGHSGAGGREGLLVSNVA